MPYPVLLILSEVEGRTIALQHLRQRLAIAIHALDWRAAE
jgi:hypothetical protein